MYISHTPKALAVARSIDNTIYHNTPHFIELNIDQYIYKTMYWADDDDAGGGGAFATDWDSRNAEVCEFAHILSSTPDSINASTHSGNRDCKYLPSPSSIIHSFFSSFRSFTAVWMFVWVFLQFFSLHFAVRSFCTTLNVVHLIFVIVFPLVPFLAAAHVFL